MANTLRYPYEDPGGGDYKGSIVFKVVDEDAIRQAVQASIVEGVTSGINALDGEKNYRRVGDKYRKVRFRWST